MRSCPFSDPIQALFSRGVPLMISSGLLIAGIILFSLDVLVVESIALTFIGLGIGFAFPRVRELVCCRRLRRRLLDRQPNLQLPRF